MKNTTIMAFIDYYKIMGIDRNTPQDAIKDAYKRRVKQFHPDLHPNDPKAKAKFQALNEANDVLSDPEKRKKYDQYGEHWKEASEYEQQHGGQGAGNGSDNEFENMDFSQFEGMNGRFSSFFEDLFGQSARRRKRATGGFSAFDNMATPDADARATVNLDMYTALLGGSIILQTQNSKLRLKVKPCTQNGSKVRLKGKGYDRGDGTFGDLIITYNIVLPSSLSEKQKQLLDEMRRS